MRIKCLFKYEAKREMPKDTVRFGTLGDATYFDLNACNIQKATFIIVPQSLYHGYLTLIYK